MFHNCVLSFPGFYSCNILCVWPGPFQHRAIEGEGEERGKGRKGGGIEKKMSLWGMVGGRELLSSPDRDLNWM